MLSGGRIENICPPGRRGRGGRKERRDALATREIGAAIEAHRNLGPGFLETIDEETLSIGFRPRAFPFGRRKTIAPGFKDVSVGEGRSDFLVSGRLVVELKAIQGLAHFHGEPMISCLKITRLHLGLLSHFDEPNLKNGLRRIILS